MTDAVAALAAVLLLVGASPAWAHAGTATPTDSGSSVPRAEPAPGTAPADPPRRGEQMLLDLLNELAAPRPRPAAEIPVDQAPVQPAVTPGVTPVPGGVPRDVVVAPRPPKPAVESATLPRPVKPPPPPRPFAGASQPAQPTAAPLPIAEPVRPVSPVDAAVPVPPPLPSIETAEASSAPANLSPEPASGGAGWYLLSLIIAAATAGAAAIRLNRARQISRTRAALALKPSLDRSAGAGSVKGLALAGPTIAIRSRLEMAEPRLG